MDMNEMNRVEMNTDEKPTILIIDDSSFNRELFRDLFETDYHILEAENGMLGANMIKKYHDQIDLVLLDLMMPVMDGFEVLNIMSQKKWINTIPVVIISTEDTPSAIERAYAAGAADFISRPFNRHILLHRIKKIIKHLYSYRKLMKRLEEQK
ncbi:MAG: response regulator [Eubacterium sp.]|nr:response regulator [Eubacterium sp.]